MGFGSQIVFDTEFFKSASAGEFDAVMVIDIDDQNLHRISDAADRIDARDVTAGQFAYVAQTVFTGEDLDKSAEVTDARNDSVVDLADLNRCGAGFDAAQRCLCRIGIGACYGDISFVIDIDRCAGVFLDRADVFAARSDQQTDLIRIDFRSKQPWCISADFGSGSRDAREHLAQDLDAGIASLLEGRSDDVFADSIDLQVQLDACDPILGSSDFEVHIAVVIFVADDVRQEHEVIFIADQSDADPGNWVGDWNACCHET